MTAHYFRIIVFFGVLLAPFFVAAESQFDHSHTAFDALLMRHVKSYPSGQSTSVDYAAFAGKRKALNAYLVLLAKVTPQQFDEWSHDKQLAFLINAYNAATIELILTRYPNISSIKELGNLFKSPWEKKWISLLGQTRSLDNIEHQLIRDSGRYNEPRIHFAINCASIGCPALRSEAFVAHRLDAQLEDSIRVFLSDRQRHFIKDKVLKISKIFRWYRDDFERGWRGIESLVEFLAYYYEALGLTEKQRQQLLSHRLDIQFSDYDWRLNELP